MLNPKSSAKKSTGFGCLTGGEVGGVELLRLKLAIASSISVSFQMRTAWVFHHFALRNRAFPTPIMGGRVQNSYLQLQH